MIRAVVDTNVYVAALLSREGSPARIIRALSEGLFDAVVCPALLWELESVLTRPKIASRLPEGAALDFLAWLGRVAVLEADPVHLAPVSADPGDDYLLALAVSSRAHVIVSGDTHLLELRAHEPRVLSPAAFATLVESLR